MIIRKRRKLVSQYPHRRIPRKVDGSRGEHHLPTVLIPTKKRPPLPLPSFFVLYLSPGDR